MNLDWILNPLTLYIVVAVGLLVCIAVFVSTQSEVCRLRRAAEESRQAMASQLEQIERMVAEIGEQKAEAAATAPPVPLLRPSLNLTRRTQALRMRRRGESAESIAAALCTPRNEIELLFKVYEMVEYRRQIQPPAGQAVSDQPLAAS